MSKWGIEEKETIDAINKIGMYGDILDVASGDGRFINELLKSSNSVTAIDIDNSDLEVLKEVCFKELVNKLKVEIVDITESFPYADSSYDGVFCTGTLHLFSIKIIKHIISEMKRVLKTSGKIVLDFATDIKRLDKNGNEVVFEGEGIYSTKEAISLFNELLKDFDYDIQISSFSEDNLGETGYDFIKGNFLIITGYKK